MKIIRELVQIVTPKKVSGISVMHRYISSDSKLMQLYTGILKNKIKTDEDAAIALYGTTETGSKYSKIKYELRERLINSIHLIPLSDHNNSKISRAYFKYYSRLTTARFLMVMGVHQAGTAMLRKILKKAQYFEFTDMVLATTRLLRSYHGTKSGDQNALRACNELINKHSKIYRSELLAEELYYDLLSQYVRDKSTKVEVAGLATTFLKRLYTDYPDHPTEQFIFRYRMIELMYCMSLQDYSGTIEICRKAVSDLSERPFHYPQHLILFYYQWISCCIQLRKLEEGFEIIIKCLALLKPKAFNWYKAKSLEMQLCFYSKDYLRAYEIYLESVNHRGWKQISPIIREEWLVYYAYLQFLLEAEVLVLPEHAQSGPFEKKIRLQKFLNATPVYNQDKKGVNVAILIIEILFLLLRRKENELITRAETFEKYMYRYLDDEGSARSKQFLKLILIAINNDFEAEKVAGAGRKSFARLRTLEHDTLSKNHAQEVIPYEDLWGIVISLFQ